MLTANVFAPFAVTYGPLEDPLLYPCTVGPGDVADNRIKVRSQTAHFSAQRSDPMI